jgi:hypothetical protein
MQDRATSYPTAVLVMLLTLAAPLVAVWTAKTRSPTRLALPVSAALTWGAAAFAYELWFRGWSSTWFFALVLPQVIVFVAAITSVVLVGRAARRDAILFGLAGYAIGLAVRAVFPPCGPAFEVAAPAVYAASAAVWACAR